MPSNNNTNNLIDTLNFAVDINKQSTKRQNLSLTKPIVFTLS